MAPLRGLPLVVLSVLAAAPHAPAQEQPGKPAGSAPASDAHKALACFVGAFDQRTEVRMGPGEPQKAHSTAVGRWILGGQFVQVDSASAPDEPRQGERLLIYGYDPQAKHYLLWNFETGSMVATTATGDYDAATRTFTFTGERAQGDAKVPFRWRLALADGGVIRQTIEMKFPGAKDYVPCVTVTHTPSKK